MFTLLLSLIHASLISRQSSPKMSNPNVYLFSFILSILTFPYGLVPLLWLLTQKAKTPKNLVQIQTLAFFLYLVSVKVEMQFIYSFISHPCSYSFIFQRKKKHLMIFNGNQSDIDRSTLYKSRSLSLKLALELPQLLLWCNPHLRCPLPPLLLFKTGLSCRYGRPSCGGV